MNIMNIKGQGIVGQSIKKNKIVESVRLFHNQTHNFRVANSHTKNVFYTCSCFNLPALSFELLFFFSLIFTI